MIVPALRFKNDGYEFPEWEEKSLEELASVERGKFSVRPRNDPKYFNGLIPFVQTGDVVFADLFLTRFSQTLNEDGLKVSKLFPKHTVLITIAANIGDTTITKFDVACTDSVVAIQPFNDKANYVWLKFSLDTKKDELESKATQNAQKNINLQILKPLLFSTPSLQEQTKIANFLTAVDQKISLLTQKADLLSQYKKGVMQQIFSQELRFKDDDGQEFPEWEEKALGDVFKVTRGNVLSMTLVSESQCEDNPYPVYSSQTKNNGLSGYFNSYLYEDSITWTTDGANAGDVNYRQGKFYCTNVCGVLINDEGYANACVAELINAVSKKFVSYVGNPKLMNNVMTKIEIQFPSVREQTKIANFLTAVDDKITINQNQLDALKQYKQGLLQQMFV